MKSRINNQDESTGWYVAILVERYQYDGEDQTDTNRLCSAEERMILVQADDKHSAYEKAMIIGEADHDTVGLADDGRSGKWKFMGLAELLPVYDKLEHGAELLSVDYKDVPYESIEDSVCEKEDLQIFQDDD